MSMGLKVSVKVGDDVVEVPVLSKDVVQNAKRNGTVMTIVLDSAVMNPLIDPKKIAADKEAARVAAEKAEAERKAKLAAESAPGKVNEVKAKAARTGATERVERDRMLREKNAENTRKAAEQK